MRKKRRGTPPAPPALSPAQQWAAEHNASLPRTPAAPEPPARVDSAEDARDLRDGIRCVISGGHFDGQARALSPVDWGQERGYAPMDFRLSHRDPRSSGDEYFAYHSWSHRRSDGIHVYRCYADYRESNT
jgi:hypothetical protein